MIEREKEKMRMKMKEKVLLRGNIEDTLHRSNLNESAYIIIEGKFTVQGQEEKLGNCSLYYFSFIASTEPC